ncbi:MAG: WecB/TagA/CpsF family glycosyltransferase [Methylovirgula sp.]
MSSDLCPVDGISIVLIARILGIPINRKVAGSDIFAALKIARCNSPLKVFFFGGPEGVAAAASAALNSEQSSIRSVGSHYPGFVTVDEISCDNIIDRINAAGADMLIAALGAKNGQLWLLRNHHRLRVPIRTHLGAVLNFQAGTVRRAPSVVRTVGLEWLWRIKEEPHLWKRYLHDGIALLQLCVTRILPLALYTHWINSASRAGRQHFHVEWMEDNQSVTLRLSGAATAHFIDNAISRFRSASMTGKSVALDLSQVSMIDSRFLGLILVLRKCLKDHGLALNFVGASLRVRRVFQLNELDFILG